MGEQWYSIPQNPSIFSGKGKGLAEDHTTPSTTQDQGQFKNNRNQRATHTTEGKS